MFHFGVFAMISQVVGGARRIAAPPSPSSEACARSAKPAGRWGAATGRRQPGGGTGRRYGAAVPGGFGRPALLDVRTPGNHEPMRRLPEGRRPCPPWARAPAGLAEAD